MSVEVGVSFEDLRRGWVLGVIGGRIEVDGEV